MERPVAVWVAIAVGSALGGVARHALTDMVGRVAGGAAPLGTLVVNVVGSLAIGVVAALVDLGLPGAWTTTARYGVMTGVLGGFTTFSAFSQQAVAMATQGRTEYATAYVAASVAGGLAACRLGHWLVTAGR